VEQWLARWAHNPKVEGSNPSSAMHPLHISRRGIEQWLARRAHNPEVTGSNPVPAIFSGKENASDAHSCGLRCSLFVYIFIAL
jgi:hypothetical protein